ncbi:Endonuclease/exonuclease/phosphatase [Chytridium lagenaria]|nr:Endonuclease/exonuclease/phosphatase [Chytridium lagenaria]
MSQTLATDELPKKRESSEDHRKAEYANNSGKRHKEDPFTNERRHYHSQSYSKLRHDRRPYHDNRNHRHDEAPEQVWINIPVDKHKTTESLEFTVLTYNVLADSLAQKNLHLYRFCPWEVLDWSNRAPRLIDEIKKMDADFVCLQEVDESAFQEIFMVQLKDYGYDGIHKKRLGDNHDGCAIFWKTSCVELDVVEQIEFKLDGEQFRDNVAIAGRFWIFNEDKSKRIQVCVGTTHLLFNPKRGHVKMAQIYLLIKKMAELAGSEIPTVLCGDFNLLPHSHLFEYILSGKADAYLVAENVLSGQEWGSPRPADVALSIRRQEHSEENGFAWPRKGQGSWKTPEFIRTLDGLVENPLKYEMALWNRRRQMALSYCTTFHGQAKHMVDYIFYSQPLLKREEGDALKDPLKYSDF